MKKFCIIVKNFGNILKKTGEQHSSQDTQNIKFSQNKTEQNITHFISGHVRLLCPTSPHSEQQFFPRVVFSKRFLIRLPFGRPIFFGTSGGMTVISSRSSLSTGNTVAEYSRTRVSVFAMSVQRSSAGIPCFSSTAQEW